MKKKSCSLCEKSYQDLWKEAVMEKNRQKIVNTKQGQLMEEIEDFAASLPNGVE